MLTQSACSVRELTFDLAQFELSDPPTDAISAIRFAPNSLKLLVSSWDKYVYLYELDGPVGRLIQKFEHRAPVLDVCWGLSEDECYSGGLDCDVRRYSLVAQANSSSSLRV